MTVRESHDGAPKGKAESLSRRKEFILHAEIETCRQRRSSRQANRFFQFTLSQPLLFVRSRFCVQINQGKTSRLSSDDCENIAKRIQNIVDLPIECKDMKHRPIVATSGSSSGNRSFLYTPTWEFLDDYSGK